MTRLTPSVIVKSPDILSGTPVFAGTRVPIKNLLDYVREGENVAEFLDDFPSVSRDQVDSVLALAETLLMETVDLVQTHLRHGSIHCRDDGGLRTAMRDIG